MPPSDPKPSFLARLFPGTVVRGAVIVCVGALILRAVSPGGPQKSSGAAAVPAAPQAAAVQPAPLPDGSSGKAPPRDRDGRWLLGTLVSGQHEVWIYSDGVQPRFSVACRAGTLLQQGLAADEVYRSFPSLPVDSLRMEIVPGGAIMHADTSPNPDE